MLRALMPFLERQAVDSILAAVILCALSAGLMMHLLHRVEGRSGGRGPWLCSTALAAGLGVWTTHFLAMLGYRTDLVLGYDFATTLASAAVAVLVVGVPFALSGLPERRAIRALLGAVSGAGIGVMHLVGMAALEGCTQAQSPAVNALACLVGAACMGLLRGLPRLRYPYDTLVACPLIVSAVCGVHFTALVGTVIEGRSVGGGLPNVQVALSVLTSAGAALLMAGAFLALAATRRFEEREAAHLRVLATALQSMSNGLLKIASDGTIQLYNARLCALIGVAPEAVSVGMRLERFLAVAGAANGWDDARVDRVVQNHWIWMAKDTETRVEHHFDSGRILSIVCQPVTDGAILTYDDVTRVMRAQEEISHLASHDPLTGLANRHALGERMLAEHRDHGAPTLLLVDLDRFKSVNDTFGHGVGDRLLVAVATRLRGLVEAGTVARLGGDELAILTRGDAAAGMALAERIVAAIEIPLVLDGITIVVGCSVGVCGGADGTGPEDLMQRAEIALYEAKRRGRGQAVCYQPGMVEAIAARGHLENDLHQAVALRQFHLVYQPILSLANDRVVSFETLIRWTHPQRGVIPPDRFIPLAEESGLIVAIGKWVLEQACREAAGWPAEQHLAVNVSAVQLRSPLLLAHVSDALAQSGLAPQRLELELTETALVGDERQIAHTLAALRGRGIRIAMDDFGTGYSSLAHLRDLPLDRIKIDRSFVAAALHDRQSLAVVKAVAQIGRDLEIPTVAEGVETREQLDFLREIGCDAVQGYFIGRPAFPPRVDFPGVAGCAGPASPADPEGLAA